MARPCARWRRAGGAAAVAAGIQLRTTCRPRRLYLEAAQREPTAHAHLSNLLLVLLNRTRRLEAVRSLTVTSTAAVAVAAAAGAAVAAAAAAAAAKGSSGGGGAAVYAAWAARRCIWLERPLPRAIPPGSALRAMPGRPAAAAH